MKIKRPRPSFIAGAVAGTAAFIAAQAFVEFYGRNRSGPGTTNALAFTVAVAVNFGAAIRKQDRTLRLFRIFRGILAAIYSAVYWANLFGGITAAGRVAIVNWIGPTACLLVWIVPNFIRRELVTAPAILAAVEHRLAEPDEPVAE